MAAKILTTALLLAASASVSAAPSRSGSRAFKLTAQLETALSGGPNVEDYEVGMFSPKPDGAILTLTHPGNGTVFTGGTNNQTVSIASGGGFGNGTSASFSCSSGAPGQWVVTPGGTATEPSQNTVNVCCPTTGGGAGGVIGSSGFTIASNGTSASSSGSILHFVGGGWMACQGGVLGVDDDYNVLSFKKDGQRPILGCQDIELVPVFV